MYAPEHYQSCTVEYKLELQPIDAIRFLPFSLGCAIKYLCRAGHKGAKADDLRKALDYLEDFRKTAYRDLAAVSYDLDTRSMLAFASFASANKYIALLVGDYTTLDELNNTRITIHEDDIDNVIEKLCKDLEDLHDE